MKTKEERSIKLDDWEMGQLENNLIKQGHEIYSEPKQEPKQEGEVVRFRVWDKVNNCESRKPHYIGSDGTLYTDCDPHGVDMSGKRTIRVNTNYELLTPAEPKEDIEFFKTSTPRPKMTNEDTRKRITNIIRENITFSGQIGDYIIHGAIEKLCDLIDENNRAWRDFHEQAEPKEEQTELLLAFKKWYDSLTPRDKCTVWPPAGSGAGHGLYNQSDEDLIQKFIHRK